VRLTTAKQKTYVSLTFSVRNFIKVGKGENKLFFYFIFCTAKAGELYHNSMVPVLPVLV